MKDKVSGAIAIPKASWGCAPALPNRIWVVSLRVIHAVFHMEHDTNKKASPCRLQATSRRQLKVFRCSSFSKMLPRCGRAAHICEANKTVWELQQTSKRELEESQLPSKQKAKMMEQGFRGNCDSQASWGCAPALPNRIQLVSLRVIHAVFHMKHDTNQKVSPCRLQATSRRRTKKFFGAAIFQKCCRGVGE